MRPCLRVLFVVMILAVFPVLAVSWQSHEHKFSFDVPDSGWSDMGAVREGILREGVVEFSSTNGSIFTVSCFPYRVEEGWELNKARKTAETTLSMIKAAVGDVWHIGEEGECRVNGVYGYHQEISFLYGGQVYSAIIVVLAKNDTHYRLVYSWPGEIYHTGFWDYRKLIASFKIQ